LILTEIYNKNIRAFFNPDNVKLFWWKKIVKNSANWYSIQRWANTSSCNTWVHTNSKCYKTFFFVITTVAEKYARPFISGKFFQAIIIFASKSLACKYEAPYMGRVSALLANIGLSRKNFPGTNSLAYFSATLPMNEKKVFRIVSNLHILSIDI